MVEDVRFEFLLLLPLGGCELCSHPSCSHTIGMFAAGLVVILVEAPLFGKFATKEIIPANGFLFAY